MNTLSLCLIVRDEELALPRLLDIAPTFADEIIVVDTGSSDATVEIAKRYGCKISNFEWKNDFSAARNYAFSLATCDYLMWLDADDVITPERASALARTKAVLSADMVMLPYYMGEPPSVVFWRERIFKRALDPKFEGRVHEAVTPRGNVIRLDIPVVHKKLKPSDPTRNLGILRDVLLLNGDLKGREAFYYGCELYYNGLVDEARKWLKKFIDGEGGDADKGQASLFSAYMERDAAQKIDALRRGLDFVFSPDLLCELGEIYFGAGDLRRARSCYLTALVADESITFPSPERAGYLPHIRLCQCYWRLGDKAKAEFHNRQALSVKPNDVFATANLALFR